MPPEKAIVDFPELRSSQRYSSGEHGAAARSSLAQQFGPAPSLRNATGSEVPMGHHFAAMSGIGEFVIDQVVKTDAVTFFVAKAFSGRMLATFGGSRSSLAVD